MFTTRPSFKRSNSAHRSLGAVYHAAPAFEALEPRQLLSASFNPVTGELVLEGSEGNDNISIAHGETPGSVIVKGVPGTNNGDVFTGVNSISIRGLGGNDIIKVGPAITKALDSTLIGVNIEGGDGNDKLFGGDGDDNIIAGNGHDIIKDLHGNNRVDAGEGHNRVLTGAGHDTILAGGGRDMINAGGGDNDISAGGGNNVVKSGTGDDVIFSGDGNDKIKTLGGNNLIIAGQGNNKVKTGSLNDTVTTGDGDDIINVATGLNTLEHGAGKDKIKGNINGGSAATTLVPLTNALDRAATNLGADLPPELVTAITDLNTTINELVVNPAGVPPELVSSLNTLLSGTATFLNGAGDLDPTDPRFQVVTDLLTSVDSSLGTALENPDFETLGAVGDTLGTTVGGVLDTVNDPDLIDPTDPNDPVLGSVTDTVEDLSTELEEIVGSLL